MEPEHARQVHPCQVCTRTVLIKGTKGMASYQSRGGRLDLAAASNSQGLMRVTGLRDGGLAAVWLSADNERTSLDGDMFGRVYSAALAPTTAPVLSLISNTAPTTGYPVNQAITALSGGGFAVMSTDNARYSASAAAANRDVAVRLYDANGSVSAQPIYLGTSTVLGTTITTLADGRLIAGWIDTAGAARAQYLSAQGALIGQPFVVAQPAQGNAARPDVAALTSGGWVGTYVVQSTNAGFAVFYDGRGDVIASRQIATDLTLIEGVQAHSLADGRVVFIWARSNAGQGVETLAQIYSNDGTAFGAAFSVSTTASSVASVAGLADGGFAIALEPAQAGPSEVKVYNSIGQLNGAALQISGAVEPSIAALADGGFVVGWKDSATGTLHAQAYQQLGAGNLNLSGTGAADVIAGQEGNDSLSGLEGADRLYGSVGNDFLNGGAGDDLLDGGSGADRLQGGAGADVLDGGLNFDLALYAGSRLTYNNDSVQQGGRWISRIGGGPEQGSDLLIDIEQARLVDGHFEYQATSTEALVMRLYDATFNRPYDPDGLSFWTNRIANGENIRYVAESFAQSSEFQTQYGNLSDRDFVAQLYRSALRREGQDNDLQFWVDYINRGGTRGDVLLGLSESAEHHAITAGALARGIWITDADAAQVSRMYDAALDRLPDLSGLTYWTDRLESGLTVEQMASGFMGSQEFQNRYGGLSNEEFVRNLYRFCLDREADANDLSYWLGRIDQGASRAYVLTSLSESGEHIARTRPLWEEGVQISDAGQYSLAMTLGTSMGEVPA
jgi:Ca2+-binding RTX toxin-like protein